MSQEPNKIIPHGGEIHFTDDKEPRPADRIEFLPGGLVKAFYKNAYEMKVYSPQVVDTVHTYTEHVEDEDWW